MGFQTSPDFKGIKTFFAGVPFRLFSFKPALISKGLRPALIAAARFSVGFKPALISKGLRLADQPDVDFFQVFQTSPDFKGIKTVL